MLYSFIHTFAVAFNCRDAEWIRRETTASTAKTRGRAGKTKIFPFHFKIFRTFAIRNKKVKRFHFLAF